jgi:hypothetical protein
MIRSRLERAPASAASFLRGAAVVVGFRAAKDQRLDMLNEPPFPASDLLTAVAADAVVQEEQPGGFLLVDLPPLRRGDELEGHVRHRQSSGRPAAFHATVSRKSAQDVL